MSNELDISEAQVLAVENGIKLFRGDLFPDRNDNKVADWKELEVNREREILRQYQLAADPNNGFWTRAKNFLAATNKAGRYGKAVKDFALMFTPYGKQIDTVTDFVTERFIKPEQKQHEVKKMNWITNRLTEKSTWRGIIAVATGVGLTLSPDQAAAIVAFGVAAAGVFEVFFKEPQSKDAN